MGTVEVAMDTLSLLMRDVSISNKDSGKWLQTNFLSKRGPVGIPILPKSFLFGDEIEK